MPTQSAATRLPFHAFHDSVKQWFADHYPAPTEVQLASWPVIAAGEHALITAPTGSGKTLTAFLWSLSQFANGAYPPGRTKVLYISPLKALNNDIQRNLLQPLQELETQYNYPQLRVLTRSGDTSQTDRQRMLRQPPDILITTPESLGLMLTTRNGRQALSSVETLILDEIHSVVDNRRGVQLMANVERLTDLSGEFQRIALSATVHPLDQVAAYVGGYTKPGHPRPVQIINTPGDKQLDFKVRLPLAVRNAADNGQKVWDPLSDTFREVIDGNQATLFFTNSRRLAEKITLKINEKEHEPLAYAHHGSLARDIRTEVEKRLKQGELKAIVATNSLEMGIDVGHLDEVVMVQSPPSVAATLQRIGRAGHRVGETSVGTLFPTHAHDFLEAAVLTEAVAERDIEPQHLMRSPLDVLAQIIVSICATDAWEVDDVFDLVTRATPYRHLQREQFDLVVEMLSGRYAGSRIRELKPRLVYDRIQHTIKATRGALLALYSSGGTIPDRGYYQMRHVDSGAALGELDEEFVWEATVGQTFTLGTQHWQIHRITHNDVMVRPAPMDTSAPPFWRSEYFNRSFHFSNRITQYLELAEEDLSSGHAEDMADKLQRNCGFDEVAADELVDYLQRQRQHVDAPLPHRHHLLLEWVNAGPAGYKGPDNPQQLVIHTFWGGQLNQPWSLALRAAWQQAYEQPVEIHADNDAIVLQVKQEVDPHQLLALVTEQNLTTLLRQSLEQSGFFGARFRECAGRSLLLTKQKFNQRLPLWMSRLQAKKLMTQTKQLADFPVLLETWRTCLDDEFDLPALSQRLQDIQDGTISWTLVRTQTPSPFAKNLTFGQVSRYMYADDTPEDDTLSALSTDLISQALHNDALRPRIEPGVIAAFEAKRQRREPGYEPQSEADWQEWLKERILIPTDELPDTFVLPADGCWIDLPDRRWVTHRELLAHLFNSGWIPGAPPDDAPEVADSRDATTLAREFLSFYGPCSEARLAALLPNIPEDLLLADEAFISGQLVADDTTHCWCDAENFEILMRFQRASRRVVLEAKSASELPLFWAALQRLGQLADHAADDSAKLFALETVRGYPAAVSTWLYDLLPARIGWPNSDLWEEAIHNYGFAWRGAGKEQMTLAYPEELELVAPNTGEDTQPPAFASGFVDPQARYTFTQIADACALPASDLNDQWWPAVWAGQLASDTLAPLKQGFERKYTVAQPAAALSSRRRLRRPALAWQGNWCLQLDAPAEDPLTRLEADKERVRLLLDRYGVVTRDIVNREHMPTYASDKPWRWRDAFRALRIMELAGEVLTGHFFEQLATPQFIAPRALSALQNNLPSAECFWLNATDPASPCGLGLDWPQLPQRRASNYLVFYQGQLAMVVENNGKDLHYHVEWDDAALDQINGVLTHLVEHRRLHLQVQSINTQPARTSVYLGALERLFTLARDHKNITLEPSF